MILVERLYLAYVSLHDNFNIILFIDYDLTIKQFMESNKKRNDLKSEHSRQERIINAIIDKEQCIWYGSMLSCKAKKKRTYSTFDSREAELVPMTAKPPQHSQNPSLLFG